MFALSHAVRSIVPSNPLANSVELGASLPDGTGTLVGQLAGFPAYDVGMLWPWPFLINSRVAHSPRTRPRRKARPTGRGAAGRAMSSRPLQRPQSVYEADVGGSP